MLDKKGKGLEVGDIVKVNNEDSEFVILNINDASIQLALETVEKQNILAQQFQEDLAANGTLLSFPEIGERTLLPKLPIDASELLC